MKLIKTFFKSIKLQKVMKKLTLLLHIAGNLTSRCLESTDNTECADRLARVQEAIDLRTDEFLDNLLKEDAVEPAKNNEVEQGDKTEKPKDTKKVEPKVEPEAKTEETTDEVKETKETETPPPDEEVETEEVLLVNPCSIKGVKGKTKELKLEGIELSFTGFISEEIATANENIYPTVEFLEDVLTHAWDMACEGMSNKVINEYLKENIGEYYSNIYKSDGDWYKISNTIYKAVGIIKNAFGYGAKDPSVQVTRPYKIAEGEEALILTKATDLTALEKKPKETPKPKETNLVDEKTPGAKVETDKDGLKTIQPGKDEQEVEEELNAGAGDEKTEPKVEKDAEENTDTVDEDVKTDDDDLSVPPAVNSFENFSDIETSVYEILNNANLNIKGATDKDEKAKIRKDSRDQVKHLVSGWYTNLDEKATWAVQGDTGGWDPAFMTYINAIVTECSKHYQD